MSISSKNVSKKTYPSTFFDVIATSCGYPPPSLNSKIWLKPSLRLKFQLFKTLSRGTQPNIIMQMTENWLNMIKPWFSRLYDFQMYRRRNTIFSTLARWNFDTAEEKGRRVKPQNFSLLARSEVGFWVSARHRTRSASHRTHPSEGVRPMSCRRQIVHGRTYLRDPLKRAMIRGHREKRVASPKYSKIGLDYARRLSRENIFPIFRPIFLRKRVPLCFFQKIVKAHSSIVRTGNKAEERWKFVLLHKNIQDEL